MVSGLLFNIGRVQTGDNTYHRRQLSGISEQLKMALLIFQRLTAQNVAKKKQKKRLVRILTTLCPKKPQKKSRSQRHDEQTKNF